MKTLSHILVFLFLFVQTVLADPATVNNVVIFSGITSQGQSGPVLPPSAVAGSNFVVLGGGCPSCTASDYYGLYQNSSGQYQVPNGKTFYITDLYFFANTPNTGARIGYGTAALGSEGTATAPTGSVSLLGFSNLAALPLQSGPTANAWMHYSYPGMRFPANDYPYIFMGGTGSNQILVVGIVQ